MARIAEIQLFKSQAKSTAQHQLGRALVGDRAQVSDICVLKELFVLADQKKDVDLRFFIRDDESHKIYLEVDKVRARVATHFNGHKDEKDNE